MPAAVAAEKEGSFTNTQRLIQWHEQAIEPPDDARSEAWFVDRLARRLRELYAGDDSIRGRQLRAITWNYWNYPAQGPPIELDLNEVVREINGYTVADRRVVPHFG